MCAGGTPANRDLLVWLRDKMPATVYAKVLQEADRVEWPFMPAAAVQQEEATPTVTDPMNVHPQWSQLKDVIKDSMRFAPGGGKLRKLTAEQRRVSDLQATALAEEAGRLEYNDALLLIGQRLRIPVDDVIHEWNFEVDWQKEWGDRTRNCRASGATSSSKPS